jgi:hypothetical protein
MGFSYALLKSDKRVFVKQTKQIKKYNNEILENIGLLTLENARD